jgi:hypothetical protein
LKLGELEVRDNGKHLAEMLVQMHYLRHYIRYEPIGVVAAIFSVELAARFDGMEARPGARRRKYGGREAVRILVRFDVVSGEVVRAGWIPLVLSTSLRVSVGRLERL